MSEETIHITIDGHELSIPQGMTILEAAKQADIDIPIICYHSATTANGLCRMCVVDVDDGRTLQPACMTPCASDSTIETHNERVTRSRRTILEMLNASVDLSEAPQIQTMMDEYQADIDRFPQAEQREYSILDDNPFYVRDYNQCVLCWRCVQVCAEDAQYTFALALKGRGHETQVSTAFDVTMPQSPCVFCGQCVGICPTGALKSKVEWGLQQGLSADEIRQTTRRKPKS